MGNETVYSSGDEVFVIDPGFEPVVQRGRVEAVHDPSVEVRFETDPMNADSDEGRTIACDLKQVLNTDASAEEVYDVLDLGL